MPSILVRIDVELYKEIKKYQEDMEFDRNRPVTFSIASRYWMKKHKNGDDLLIRF